MLQILKICAQKAVHAGGSMKFSGITLKGRMIAFLAMLTIMVLAAETPAAAGRAEEPQQRYRIAVFIPGVTAGSPIYDMLARGAQRAADEFDHVTANIIEGGTNQGEWTGKISSIAAQGDHDLIVTSNPAMPEIVNEISQRFTTQKFIVMDGHLEGNPNIYTLRYDQYQQAYLAGYFAGLVTASSMDHSRSGLRIGLIAGQEYPDMNRSILPGYRDGAQDAAPGTAVDFRVVGNWYDASKGKELAREMISAGADVLLPISGGANYGVLEAAIEHNAYVIWYDTSGYYKAPGVVIGSTELLQDEATYMKVKAAVLGELPFGSAETVGVEEGFVRFVSDDPLFEAHVPEEVRNRMMERISQMQQ